MHQSRKLNWFDMDETLYRASQICRVLGNPKAIQILEEIRRLGQSTPGDLASRVNRSLHAVSVALKHLREIQLVRYQRDGKHAVYRLKDRQVAGMLEKVKRLADHLRKIKK